MGEAPCGEERFHLSLSHILLYLGFNFRESAHCSKMGDMIADRMLFD